MNERDFDTAAIDSSAEVAQDSGDLIKAIEGGDAPACAAWLEAASRADAIHDLATLDASERASLLRLLPAEAAVDVISMLPEELGVAAVESLEPVEAAAIIDLLPSDERAALVRELEEDNADAILAELAEHVAHETRRLAGYDEDTVGSLMLTEYLAFRDSATVREVLADLEANAEAYRDYNIQYTYVIDANGGLLGVLPLRNLLLARRGSTLGEVMIPDPVRVVDTGSLDVLRDVFTEHPFLGLPVVSEGGVLVGVVERSDFARSEADEADEVYRQSQGIVGGEELRSMPLLRRSRRRLAWLSANIVLNIIAASMIALHQDTLEAVIALAVFLPIISDMSGCSGNQAVAVTMRELTLGVTRPADTLRVLFKESTLGLINGTALGVLIGGVAYLWKGNVYLGLVVGVALALNTVIAVCIGGMVPLVLKRFKADPALASGPILTTITDMCGFFIVLTIASLMLAQLT
ncbi:MAG: magnesium transporter [Phycisphaerales bacterium]